MLIICFPLVQRERAIRCVWPQVTLSFVQCNICFFLIFLILEIKINIHKELIHQQSKKKNCWICKEKGIYKTNTNLWKRIARFGENIIWNNLAWPFSFTLCNYFMIIRAWRLLLKFGLAVRPDINLWQFRLTSNY